MKLLTKLGLRGGLALAVAPLCLGALWALYFASHEVLRLGDDHAEVMSGQVKTLEALSRARQVLGQTERLLFELGAESEPDKALRVEAELDSALAAFREQASALGLSRLAEDYLAKLKQIRSKARAKEPGQGPEAMREQYRSALLDAGSGLLERSASLSEAVSREAARASREGARAGHAIWLAGLSGLAVTLFAAWLIWRKCLIAPLRALGLSLRNLALEPEAEPEDAGLSCDFGEIEHSVAQIRRSARESADQAFVRSKLSECGQALRQSQDYAGFASLLFDFILENCELCFGSLYLAKSRPKSLSRVAGFALNAPQEELTLSFGQGLAGQCVLQGKSLELAPGSPDEIKVAAGFGHILPKHVAYYPLLGPDGCLGVLELAFTRAPQGRAKSLLAALPELAAESLERLVCELKLTELSGRTSLLSQELERNAHHLAKSQEELRQAKTALEGICEALPGLAYQLEYSLDNWPRFRFLGPNSADVLGVGREELLADAESIWRNVEDAESLRAEMDARLRQAFSGEAVRGGQGCWRVKSGGAEREVLVCESYLPGQDGTVLAYGYIQTLGQGRVQNEAAKAGKKRVKSKKIPEQPGNPLPASEHALTAEIKVGEADLSWSGLDIPGVDQADFRSNPELQMETAAPPAAPASPKPAEAAKVIRQAWLIDEPPLPDKPGLSPRLGLSRVGGNQALYRQLAFKFAAQNADAASRIRELLDKEETKGAGKLALSLKSAARNIGAEELALACQSLEEALAGEATSAARDLLIGLSGLLELTVVSIHALKLDLGHKEETPAKATFEPLA